jgi:transcriptional regulator with XRE-family HTH domain
MVSLVAIDQRVLQGAERAEHIRPNLIRLRNLFHLADTELARLSGIKRQTLVNKLHGIGQFTAPELGRLAAVWRMAVDRLYDDPSDFKQWVADHEDELERAMSSQSWQRLLAAEPPELPIPA